MNSAWARNLRRRKGIPGVAAGLFIGAAVGLAVGAVIGAALGWYNEATLAGNEYEELFIGFGEYSMQGMAFWSALVSATYGGIAGAASGAVAWASRLRKAGLAVGVALPLVLWASTGMFQDGRNQAAFVWCAGMLTGGVGAALFCGRGRTPVGPAEPRRCT